MVRALAIAVALTSGCATGPTCGHAAETTYRCMPLIADVKGCLGGPHDGDAVRERVFPVGCQVDVPECSEIDPGIPRVFECVVGTNGEADWYEPI